MTLWAADQSVALSIATPAVSKSFFSRENFSDEFSN
jgi:hypothetical protein